MLTRQKIRELGTRALRDRLSATLHSLRAGERVVVTRHHDPLAVLLSVRDAMELIAGPRMAEAGLAAVRDLARGEVAEPWPDLRHVRILLAREAAARFERTVAQDRFALRRLLIRGDVDPGLPLWVPSGRLLVGLSEHPPDGREEDSRGVILIHGLIDARELERELIGETVWGARARRDHDRCIHARAPVRSEAD